MKKIFWLLFVLLLLACAIEADPFTTRFYKYVNTYRTELGLSYLERSESVEKVAITYSCIIAGNGEISHAAITDFEFKKLCENYGIEMAVMREILMSLPSYKTPLDIFGNFLGSEAHRLAILDPNGRFIGAGYVVKENKIYFTAYIVIPKDETWN